VNIHCRAVAPKRLWEAPEKFFLVVPSTFLALKVQLVVLVSAFVMVSRSTVWAVCYLLFFYSRCPRAQPFVKVGDLVPPVPYGVGARRHCCRASQLRVNEDWRHRRMTSLASFHWHRYNILYLCQWFHAGSLITDLSNKRHGSVSDSVTAIMRLLFAVPGSKYKLLFVVVGLLCECRPAPQIILALVGKKFPLGGIVAALLQC